MLALVTVETAVFTVRPVGNPDAAKLVGELVAVI